jgi:hypothetical protein
VGGILRQLVRRIRHKYACNLVHLSKRKAKMTFPLILTIKFTFISDNAANSSQHAHPCFKHYSSSGQMSFWADVLLGKCLLRKCLSGQTSFWANVRLGKCLLGKCLSGQMSFWANVFWANVLWANVHLGKCLSGQMSLGKCCMGKCRVTGEMNGMYYKVFGLPVFSYRVGEETFVD